MIEIILSVLMALVVLTNVCLCMLIRHHQKVMVASTVLLAKLMDEDAEWDELNQKSLTE